MPYDDLIRLLSPGFGSTQGYRRGIEAAVGPSVEPIEPGIAAIERPWQEEARLLSDPAATEPEVSEPVAPSPAEQSGLSQIADLLMATAPPGLVPHGVTPGAREKQRFIARHGLPIAGMTAGAVGGAAAAPFTLGIVNPITGEMAGGAAGEALAQQLGLAEESTAGIVTAAAAPPVARGVVKAGGAALRGGAKLFPGVATWLQEEAIKTLGGFVNSMRAAIGSVDDAWAAASATGKDVRVGTDRLVSSLDDLAGDERLLADLGAEAPATLKRLGKLREKIGEIPQISMKELDLLRRRAGEWVGAAERKGGPTLRMYRGVYKAIMETAEQAGDVFPVLRVALDKSKVHLGLEELGSVIKDKGIRSLPSGELQFKPGAIFEAIRRNEDLVRLLGPGRVKAIDAFTKELARGLPKIGGRRGELVVAGIAAGVGAEVGGPFGAAIGAVTGPTILRTFSDSVGRAVLSDSGRQVLRRLFYDAGGKITPELVASVVQLGRSINTGTLSAQPPIPTDTKRADEVPQTKSEIEKVFGF